MECLEIPRSIAAAFLYLLDHDRLTLKSLSISHIT